MGIAAALGAALGGLGSDAVKGHYDKEALKEQKKLLIADTKAKAKHYGPLVYASLGAAVLITILVVLRK